MGRKSNKISTRWIRETRNDFRAFLDETDFPDPQRMGERGPNFKYPEWLIILKVWGVSISRPWSIPIHQWHLQSCIRPKYRLPPLIPSMKVLTTVNSSSVQDSLLLLNGWF